MQPAEALIGWYHANKRDLPWRHRQDAYGVLVSEAMLQQTQVKTVLPFYKRFMDRFPEPEELAKATDEEILATWQGLGYYRRVRNLRAAVGQAVASGWPVGFADWMKLPGVGKYTAAAMSSIVEGERVAAVDGNVERVYARYAGDAGGSLNGCARSWAQALMDSHTGHPGDFNQALMELGAVICTPRNPACSKCPLARGCAALAHEQVSDLPARAPKREAVPITRYGLAFRFKGLVALTRIPKGEWWEGMWTLPWSEEVPEENSYLGSVRQTVTHHRVTFHIHSVEIRPEGSEMFSFGALPALPALQRKALALVRD